MVKNKKGWIKIVEAFLAILLLITIILLAVNTRYLNVDKERDFYKLEDTIFKVFQLNDTFRNTILKTPLPMNSSDENFPPEIITKIKEITPSGVNCSVAFCPTNSSCELSSGISKSIYAQEILIVGNSTTYSPRIVKLACY